MPVAPTYPGVYIEEIPSGVHTITGVGTSITAFIGYTPRGSVNQPIHIFSFADFERAFGGLALDSPLSYCVKQFFQNGGTEAYIVRVAQGALAASVTMRDSAATRLVASAATAGTWGNNLQIDVDYATSNPASLFNLTTTEFVIRNGEMVPGRVEMFRNLSMGSLDPNYVVSRVNAGSELLQVALSSPITITTGGRSVSGVFTTGATVTVDGSHRSLGVVVNGLPPFQIDLPAQTGTVPTILDTIATDIENAINAVIGGGSVTHTAVTTTNVINIQSNSTGPASAVHFTNASNNDAASVLRLGLANGGVETDASAPFRPQQTGIVSTAPALPTTATGGITIQVKRGSAATVLKSINLPIWGAPTTQPIPTSLDLLATQIGTALAGMAAAEPYLAGATAQRIGNAFRILPGPADPNISFDIVNFGADVTATTLGLVGGARNVARYAPGVGLTALAQVAGATGNDGSAPGASDLTGSQAAKTGIYALENVDLFNLLVMPDATAGAGMMSVLTEAIAYCTRRRAFIIIDAPETIATFAQAQTWIGGPASPLRSRNSGLYFPRLREPDPMMDGTVRSFAAAGALAGLYARTDAGRGVWKAPAGTDATLVGATGLSYTLTDGENGNLNPQGLNCLRTFPIYGTIAWGARTGRGADALADEYKYIPVRRLALFLEESLYRGTQWAVFEPNDEPLWAQIRLNLGAFMHTLFAQGAFQGRSAREAYFVKCDKETTTQNDIDLGRVNIVVGFAPLKPAEFVIIRIQQIAGAIQT